MSNSLIDRWHRLEAAVTRAWQRFLQLTKATQALLIIVTFSVFQGLYLMISLPDLQQLSQVASNVQIIVDKKGHQITFRQAIVNIQVDFSDFPQHLIAALLTMEDRKFFSHSGVDYRGIGRAVFQRVSGTGRSGGSTITQQLARNMFLSHEQTLFRKLKEAILALKLEMYFSKTKILEMYLNRIYFGKGVNGVEAAARKFFHKSARDLLPFEAAILVGSIPRPDRWNYLSNRALALQHGEFVLKEMRRREHIDDQTIANAKIQPGNKASRRVDYISLLDFMRPTLYQHLKNKNGQFTVITTFDPEIQLYAEISVRRWIKKYTRYNVSEAALVAIAPNGAVKAMVGSVDRAVSTMNHATQARRQIGSAFKPIVYLTALQAGWDPNDRISGSRLDIDGWKPRNVDDKYPASVTLATALSSSINTATIRLSEKTGRNNVIKLATNLSNDCRYPDHPGLALGVGECTLLGITNIYSTFPAGGVKMEPFAIAGIRDKLGNIVFWTSEWSIKSRSKRIASEGFIRKLNRMLIDVVLKGTGKQAALPNHEVAGKTGTTQDNRDAWFIGFSTYLTAGVWVGNRDNRPMNGIYGSNLPAQIWRNFMASVHEVKGYGDRALPGGGYK